MKRKSGALGSRSCWYWRTALRQVLAGHRVLELARRHRHAVEREDEVERVALARVARHLPRDGQLVALEAREGVRVEAVRRREVRDAEGASRRSLNPWRRTSSEPLSVEFARERARRCADSRSSPWRAAMLRPIVGLRLADEGDGARGEQRPVDIPLAELACAPAGLEEHRLDGGLEGLLGGVGGHVAFGCVPASGAAGFSGPAARGPGGAARRASAGGRRASPPASGGVTRRPPPKVCPRAAPRR